MRTWDNRKRDKIITILYEYEPDGIGFRELCRKSGYAKKTIDRWLNRLRDMRIIKKTPKFPIHLTYKSIQKYKNNSLFTADDTRKKILKTTKDSLSEREKKSIILILSLMAFGVYKSKKYNKPKAGLIEIRNPFVPEQSLMYGGKTVPFVKINDVVSRIHTKSPDSISKIAHLPTKKINYGNNELFGYLNIKEEEANALFKKLINHNPPIIRPSKMKYKTTEIRYIIADDQLKGFVTNCILTFNHHVEERLLYSYIYDLFRDIEKEGKSDILKKGQQLKEYKKNMKIWFGTKRKTKAYFGMMDSRKQELKEMKKDEHSNEALELTQHFKKFIIDLDNNIKNRQLFDDKFENVHLKYDTLLDKYGVIVNIFLDILFPQFIREIWKSEIKNMII